MNAYELTKDRADILADELLAYHHKGVCGRAAKMLRQQADRIAELEKVLEHEGISVGRDLLNGGVALSKKLPQTKPLSDEEIKELIVNKTTDYELCRAIEERHGIK